MMNKWLAVSVLLSIILVVGSVIYWQYYYMPYRALFFAVKGGDVAEVQEFIDAGVPVVRITHAKDSRTFLHTACSGGNERMVRFLLNAGANANARSRGGWTPLHAAANNGHKEIVQILLAAGADPAAKAVNGGTPEDCSRDEVQEVFKNWEASNTTSPQIPAKAESPSTPKAGAAAGKAESSEDVVPDPDGPATGK